MGDGAFSNVYKAIERKSGRKVAVKVVRKYELNSSQVRPLAQTNLFYFLPLFYIYCVSISASHVLATHGIKGRWYFKSIFVSSIASPFTLTLELEMPSTTSEISNEPDTRCRMATAGVRVVLERRGVSHHSLLS